MNVASHAAHLTRPAEVRDWMTTGDSVRGPAGLVTDSEARRLHRLLDLAERLEVDVHVRDLGATRRGHYLDDFALIELNVRLSGFQRVSTLAHELAHAMFRDRRSTPEIEARAKRVAAAWAVEPVEVRQAITEGQVTTLRLGVAPNIIEALELA